MAKYARQSSAIQDTSSNTGILKETPLMWLGADGRMYQLSNAKKGASLMIDDVCQEIIDSDSERFMWIAMNVADEIAGIDLHELASALAEKNGREEPNYEDYGDAVRVAIDKAENDAVNEKWRREQMREMGLAMDDCENRSALPRAE